MTDQTSEPTPTTDTYSKDFVDKVLNEKKNAMATLAELKQKVNTYEAQLKEAEEARLKEKEDWKGYAENKAKEAQGWQEKYQGLEQKLQTQVKIGAVRREFEKLGVKDGRVVESVVPLLKLDAIKYDENTQTVIGADEEVLRLKETLPQLFAVQSSAGVNHNAPTGSPSAYTVEKLNEMARNGASIKEIREYQKQLMTQFAK